MSSLSSSSTLVKSEKKTTRWGPPPVKHATAAPMEDHHTPEEEAAFMKSAFSTTDSKSAIASINSKYSDPITSAASTPITSAAVYPTTHSAVMHGLKADPTQFTGSSYATPRGVASPVTKKPASATEPAISVKKEKKYTPIVVGKDEAETVYSSDDEDTKQMIAKMGQTGIGKTTEEQMRLAGWKNVLKSLKKNQGNITFALRSMYEKNFPNIQKYINRNENGILAVPFGKFSPFAINNIIEVDSSLTAVKKYDEDYLIRNGLMPERFSDIPMFHLTPNIIQQQNETVHMIHTLCFPMTVYQMMFPLRKGMNLMEDIFSHDALKSGNRYFWRVRLQPDGDWAYMASLEAMIIGAGATFSFDSSAGSIGKVTKEENEAPRRLMVQIFLAIANFKAGAQSALSEMEFQARGLLQQQPVAVIPPEVQAELKELRIQKALAETQLKAAKDQLAQSTKEALGMYDVFKMIETVNNNTPIPQLKSEITNRVFPNIPDTIKAANKRSSAKK